MLKIVEQLTYAQYLDVALSGEPQEGSPSKGEGKRNSRLHEDSDWRGTSTWEQAANLAQFGWTEGREQVGKIMSQIEAVDRQIVRPAPVWDVTGDFVDVGRFCSGDPENMVRWEDRPQSKRIVRIAVNMCVSAGVSAQTIRWSGACLLALVDRLEMEGVQCEIDMIFGIKGVGNGQMVCAVNLKTAGEPLWIDRMAFHMAHPSSLRRLMFSYLENQSPERVRIFGSHNNSNYGYPMQVEDIQKMIKKTGLEYDLFPPTLHLNTVESAIAKMEELYGQIFAENPITGAEIEKDSEE